ncbi:MAG: aspartate 1-decarboxylase [Pseudomonadota bacterium]
MRRSMLKSKIHRATVTDANLDYEGSITIDSKLCDAARILPYEKVEIYNLDNGRRFSTYVMYGRPGEVCINGAAARLVSKGEKVIIASYAEYDEQELGAHRPFLILVDAQNRIQTPPPAQR